MEKVYQLCFGNLRGCTGEYFVSRGRIYSSLEEANKAMEFAKLIPDDPCADFWTEKVYVEEMNVEEKFKPWFTSEELENMRNEYDYSEFDSHATGILSI